MARADEITHGRVEQVGANTVLAPSHRRWLTAFTLGGRRMFYLGNDVSLFARNYEKPFDDGDEIISLGGPAAGYSGVNPGGLGDGNYRVIVLHNIITGRTFGSSGQTLTIFGTLAAAVGFGIVVAVVSAGQIPIASHLKLLAWALVVMAGGALSVAQGASNRRNWMKVQPKKVNTLATPDAILR